MSFDVKYIPNVKKYSENNKFPFSVVSIVSLFFIILNENGSF